MKTKNKVTLLAFTAILSAANLTSAEIPATPPIDSLILQVMTTGSMSSGPLCGGMDDDQIVGGDGANFVRPNTCDYSFGTSQTGALHGSTSNSSSLTNNLNNEVARFTAPVSGSPSMTTDGGGWTLMIAGGNGNDTFVPPVNRGLTTDPLGICGGNGNDSIIVGGVGIDYVGSAGTTAVTTAIPGAHSFYADSTGAFPLASPINGAPSYFTNDAGALPPANQANQTASGTGMSGGPRITGDAGNDTLVDRQILQLMATGSFCGDDVDNDDLQGNGDFRAITGDGGADTVIYGETGSDSLYGGNGADTLRQAPGANGFVWGTMTYGFVFGTTSY